MIKKKKKREGLIPEKERREQELKLLAEWEAENPPKGRCRITDSCLCLNRVTTEETGTKPQGVRWCLTCQQPMYRKVKILAEG